MSDDEEEEEEEQAKKESIIETKKEDKKKEKKLKDLLENNNNNNYNPKKKTVNKNNYNNSNQYYKNENRDYEPKKFFNSKRFHDNDRAIKNDNYEGKRYDYNYKKNNYRNYNNYEEEGPSPHFINSSKKEINNDTRVANEEKYNKYNYKKREDVEYKRPKFYGKIKTNTVKFGKESKLKYNPLKFNFKKNRTNWPAFIFFLYKISLGTIAFLYLKT